MKFYRDLILDISKFNWIAFLISVFCIVLLLLTKEVLQPRLDKIKWYPKVPFPTDLILVLFWKFVLQNELSE